MISKMETVNSSNIHSVGHGDGALYVRFKGAGGMAGPLYRYPTAGAEHHEALLKVDSPGRYFLNVIKGRHAGERVDE